MVDLSWNEIKQRYPHKPRFVNIIMADAWVFPDGTVETDYDTANQRMKRGDMPVKPINPVPGQFHK